MSKIECPNCRNQSDDDTWVHKTFSEHQCPSCNAWIPEKVYKAIVSDDAALQKVEKEGGHVKEEQRRKAVVQKMYQSEKRLGTSSVKIEPETNPYSTWWNGLAALLVIFGLGVALISLVRERHDAAIGGLALALASLPLFLWAYVMNMAQRALRYLSIIAKRMDEREE
jgi:hypothetical protein